MSNTVTDKTLEAWHERQAALTAWRKKDSSANRERLEMARRTMDAALEDGYDCE